MHLHMKNPPPRAGTPGPLSQAFLRAIEGLSRDQVEAAVEHMIDQLDKSDGDPDVEDDDPDTCQAGDDGMAVIITRFGPRWGSEHDCAYAEGGSWPEQVDQDAPPAVYADDGQEDDGATIRRAYRDRARDRSYELVHVGLPQYGWDSWQRRSSAAR